MVIFLPDDNAGFKEIEKFESYNLKNAYLEKLKARDVSVGIPKFKIETRLELNEYLPQVRTFF